MTVLHAPYWDGGLGLMLAWAAGQLLAIEEPADAVFAEPVTLECREGPLRQQHIVF